MLPAGRARRQGGGLASPSPPRPLVSVVLPVRDGEATLDAALASLHAQTYPRFEVLVVDDGSRDATSRIARAWARRDGRFRLVESGAGDGAGRAAGARAATYAAPASSGIVAALQRGLAVANGAYIARMDADDRCHPERLAVQLELLERDPGLAGCGAGVRYVPPANVTPRAAEYAAWLNDMTSWDTVEAGLFVECPLAHPTFMFRAEALVSVGGYRDRGWPEDYDLLLRLWRSGHRFVSVPRVLLDWNNGPGRLSRTHPAYTHAAFRACKVHHLRRSLLAGREGVVVWGAGPTGKRLAVEFRRRGVRVHAFIEVDARKIGQVIHGAPVREAEAAREFKGALHLGAVARAAGREAVRAVAVGAGVGPGDFVAMA
ncbi:MAG: glycosyltransferase [Gemmatimonadota bacterium]|nr:glycosyltransferase [Gemmatimonadota bacterium]